MHILALINLQMLETLGIESAEALLRLTMLFLLVLAIAFFVAAELAIVASSPDLIDQLSQQTAEPGIDKASSLVKHAQNNLQQYLSVTQTGTTAGSLLLGWLGEGATVHWIEPWLRWLPLGHVSTMITAHSIAVVVAFLLVTYVEILLGELVPKVLAAQAPERTALTLIRPLQVCSYLFWPLLVLLNSNVRFLTGWLSRPEAISGAPTTHGSIVRLDPHSAMVSGGVALSTLNQELGLSLPSELAYRTMAGFMIHQLGRSPHPGEHLVWGELELEAVSVVEGRLEKVLLRQVTRPLQGNPLDIAMVGHLV